MLPYYRPSSVVFLLFVLGRSPLVSSAVLSSSVPSPLSFLFFLSFSSPRHPFSVVSPSLLSLPLSVLPFSSPRLRHSSSVVPGFSPPPVGPSAFLWSCLFSVSLPASTAVSALSSSAALLRRSPPPFDRSSLCCRSDQLGAAYIYVLPPSLSGPCFSGRLRSTVLAVLPPVFLVSLRSLHLASFGRRAVRSALPCWPWSLVSVSFRSTNPPWSSSAVVARLCTGSIDDPLGRHRPRSFVASRRLRSPPLSHPRHLPRSAVARSVLRRRSTPPREPCMHGQTTDRGPPVLPPPSRIYRPSTHHSLLIITSAR